MYIVYIVDLRDFNPKLIRTDYSQEVRILLNVKFFSATSIHRYVSHNSWKKYLEKNMPIKNTWKNYVK